MAMINLAEDLDFGELPRISSNADCSKCQICWNNDWPAWTPSSLDCSPKKIIQRVMTINASSKSPVERLCDFKIHAISVLSFIGCSRQSHSHNREHAFSVPQQDGTTLFRLPCFKSAPSVDLALI